MIQQRHTSTPYPVLSTVINSGCDCPLLSSSPIAGSIPFLQHGTVAYLFGAVIHECFAAATGEQRLAEPTSLGTIQALMLHRRRGVCCPETGHGASLLRYDQLLPMFAFCIDARLMHSR